MECERNGLLKVCADLRYLPSEICVPIIRKDPVEKSLKTLPMT
jgi:hypothetical protein